jgi:hypothetical protein
MSALCRHFQSRDAGTQAVRKVEGASSTAAAAADSTADLFVPLRYSCAGVRLCKPPSFLIDYSKARKSEMQSGGRDSNHEEPQLL